MQQYIRPIEFLEYFRSKLNRTQSHKKVTVCLSLKKKKKEISQKTAVTRVIMFMPRVLNQLYFLKFW